MRLLSLNLAIILLVFCFKLSAKPAFDKYFADGCLRYDFELIGNAQTANVVHVQTKYLPKWGGNPNNLIDDLDYGNYRVRIVESENGKLIFQQGFSPLFMEYQTTLEAKTQMGSFYQAVFFPKPIVDVVLTIENRTLKNLWQQIFSDTIKLSNYFVLNETPAQYQSTEILKSGDSSKKIDLLIISEGYTSNEMDKFIADTKRLTDSLFASKPFCDLKDHFNVTAVEVLSLESGTDIPGLNIYKNTAFNSHFYTFNTARYLTTSDMKSIYDVLDGFCFDQIYVLVNTDMYGGGGFYNFLNVCTSDNNRSPFVFIHEFGHGFAGLADEYYTSETSFEEFYKKGNEPWEPNLTTLVDFKSKWKKMLDKSTPIPTLRDSAFTQTIGVYEGGGYVAKGIYSPMMTCWMKEQKANGFCPVCIKAIENVILNQTK